MKDFWDNRYADKAYAYGTQPNDFFKNCLEKYDVTGSILLPAEGEGRNAVYAATRGLDVTAFDISIEGQKKALKLADENKVKINYYAGAFEELDFKDQQFDAAALIFAHFPPDLLSVYHERIAALIKPGGLLILEGFSKNHIRMQETNPDAGGPKNVEMLFSEESIASDFPGFEILKLEEDEVELHEGKYHNGLSRVIRFVGRKKN